MTLKRKRGGNGFVQRKRRRWRQGDPMVIVHPVRRYLGSLTEMKSADFSTAGDAFATTWTSMEDGTILSVSGIAIGTADDQRIGRRILIHSIHIKYRMHVNASEMQTTPPPDLIGRMALVLDSQTNKAQLTATDVFTVGPPDFQAFRDLDHTSRYRVLLDVPFKIPSVGINEGASDLFAQQNATTSIRSFHKKFPKPIPVLYDGDTNVIGVTTDNSFHIIGVANQTTALLTYVVRLRYTG